MSPAKAAAPQIAEAAAATTPPNTQALTSTFESSIDLDFFGKTPQKSTPRSLFSSKESEYLPGSKRKFELDFESPKSTKKAKMEETSASSKRKRDFEFETPQKKPKSSYTSQTMPAKPRSAIDPMGPTRSAMKPLVQPRTPATGQKKTVTFGQEPLTGTRIVHPSFGRAGVYKGSVFADVSPTPFSSPEASISTPSTISDTGSSQLEMSPTTKNNTEGNTPGARSVFCEDPYDPFWRPRPHNPRPGQFCLPDDLSQYDDEDDESNIFEQSTPMKSTIIGDNTPDAIRQSQNSQLQDSPDTPRLSHAHLPLTSTQGAQPSSSTVSHSTFTPLPSIPPTSSTLPAEADPSAIDKARAAAEKYKPASIGKQASKLSQVTSARSRSSSPPPRDDELQQRLDSWARNLAWPAMGERIVEEEVFNSEMMGRIRREWTEEDDEQSKDFWEREFERVVEAGRKAGREGKVLMFV
jgi:hypothetical protein